MSAPATKDVLALLGAQEEEAYTRKRFLATGKHDGANVLVFVICRKSLVEFLEQWTRKSIKSFRPVQSDCFDQ